MENKKIVFFGGEPLGIPALEALAAAGIIPQLIVCSPDRPAGRGLPLVPPAVKQWAQTQNIEVFQPENYQDESAKQKLFATEWDLFVVVAYNFILPKWLLELPKKGCLNVHPSLLPALRGPSPIRTAILQNQPEAVGVTVMLLDEKMDTGPILQQQAYQPKVWPISGPILDGELAAQGGKLLAQVTPAWLAGEIEPKSQNHELATYTKMFKKGANELHISPLALPSGAEAFSLLCKIKAWEGIGDTFFVHNDKRIKIKAAGLSADSSLELYRVVPEGKAEMDFNSYLQSLAAP